MGVDLSRGAAARVAGAAAAVGLEPVVRYFTDGAGNVGHVVGTSEETASIPEGWAEIPAEAYAQRAAELEQQHAEYLAGLEAADRERAEAAYTELLGLGLSAELAARLSGRELLDLDLPGGG